MALRSGRKSDDAAAADDNVDQTPPQQTRTREPQEEHAPAPPPPSRQHLILHFFRSMVQAQEQYTKNLRKGTEHVPEIAPARDQEIPTCSYCRKRGHLEKDCYSKAGLCWGCGSDQHRHKGCPDRRSTAPAIQKDALPAARGGPARRPQTRQQQKVTPYRMHDVSVCKFCKRRGHVKEDCRRLRLGLCLSCGSDQHRVKECSKKQDTAMTGERPALPEHIISQPEDKVDRLPAQGGDGSGRPDHTSEKVCAEA
ncbi:uncharacterized protein M6B38_198430 [Iris pallida]|uniref:CCHC-type domain-containing protein n=1 Tax=Iris pallida TaxID=29817 RepID=A0AAX6EBF7_IRIPA|nr:uncharacterized protein M6B38_198430 [Iris pallida]